MTTCKAYKPDYKFMKQRALEAHDLLSVLTFDTYWDSPEGHKLVTEACSAIAALYRYAKEKGEKDEG